MQGTQSWQDPAAACPPASDKAAAAMSDPEDVTDEEADGHLCEKAFCVRHWGPSAQADQPVHQPTLRCNCFCHPRRVLSSHGSLLAPDSCTDSSSCQADNCFKNDVKSLCIRQIFWIGGSRQRNMLQKRSHTCCCIFFHTWVKFHNTCIWYQ